MQRGLSLPTQRKHEHDEREQRQARLLHDARGAVGAILMLGAAAELDADDEQVVRRRLREIMSEARWLGDLIDSEWADDTPRLVDIGDVVRTCVERVRLVAATVTIRCETETGTTVSARPVGLQRAVTNVVANAARAAGPDGEVVVSARQGGDDVVVEVLDDGPGFGRVPIVHGLGLSITREVVAAAGGTVEIADGPDGGTRVRLRLPHPAAAALPRSGA
jgi:signal transduction histidine kinase